VEDRGDPAVDLLDVAALADPAGAPRVKAAADVGRHVRIGVRATGVVHRHGRVRLKACDAARRRLRDLALRYADVRPRSRPVDLRAAGEPRLLGRGHDAASCLIDCCWTWDAASSAARYARTASRGEAAPNTPETTATPRAPVSMHAATRSGVTP